MVIAIHQLQDGGIVRIVGSHLVATSACAIPAEELASLGQ